MTFDVAADDYARFMGRFSKPLAGTAWFPELTEIVHRSGGGTCRAATYRRPILHPHSQDLFFGVQVEVLSASVSVPLSGRWTVDKIRPQLLDPVVRR